MIKLLLQYLRPYRWHVFLVLLLTFAQVMCTLYLPNLMSNIVDLGIVKGNVPYIVRVGLLMFAITLLGGATSVVASFYASKSSAGFGQLLGLDIFKHVERFSPREFDQIGTSSLIVRTTNDVMQVQQLVYMLLRMTVMAPLTAVGGIILAVHTSPRLSPVIVVVLPVMGLAIYLVMGRALGLFSAIQGKVDRVSQVLRENLTGTRVIRSFGRVPYELDRFDGANLDLTWTSVSAFQLMATMMPVVMLIMNLSSVGIAWFGGVLINHGALQVGQLMAFIQYATQIMMSVMMVSMMFFMIPRGQASATRIHEVFGIDPQVADPERPLHLPAEVRARLEFDHVTFSYPGAQEPALSDISFSAGPGEITAIIGGTGAGKSTLLQLIPRLNEVSAGTVRLNGVDIRALPQEELRTRIAYVPQRAVLFSGTVADNVRYGDGSASEPAVREAVEVAQASDFVEELGGLDAPVSQSGLNLSGGQRQRLSIARALVRGAEVLLFDDSFSALDYRTDARLRAALRGAVGEATVLIVAQRVSTVMDADRILVLDEGRLVGCGRHADLLETCPVYQEIVASQLSPEVVA